MKKNFEQLSVRKYTSVILEEQKEKNVLQNFALKMVEKGSAYFSMFAGLWSAQPK